MGKASDPRPEDVSATYEAGTAVEVTAHAAVGHEFVRWEGDYPSGERASRSLSVTVDSETTLSPVFRESDGEQTIVAYDPQDERFDNYTVDRTPDASFDSASAELPDGVTWSDVPNQFPDRTKRNVSVTASYPWSAVGQLTHSGDGYCSATVVEGNHVITAGHCVYTDGAWAFDSGYSDTIEFIPGRNGGERPFSEELLGPAEVEYIQTYDKWVDQGNQAYDVAVLTLDRNLARETGTFSYEGRSADSSFYGSEFDYTQLHTTGYPAREAPYVSSDGTAQWDLDTAGQGTDILQSGDCRLNNMCHKIATGQATNELLYPGNSGGPVWTTDDRNRPTLVSVVSSGPEILDSISDGIAVRLSRDKYSDIGKMIRRGNSVDLQPVANLTAESTTVSFGEPVALDAGTSLAPDEPIESYEWDFNTVSGDGTDTTTATPQVTHTYGPDWPLVTAEVTVVSSDGDTDTATLTIRQSEKSVDLSQLHVSVDNATECGLTCREIDATIENPTDSTITNLTANASISAGGEQVWSDERTLEEIPPGTTPYNATVDLDTDGASTVIDNDGEVTVRIEVTAGGQSRTFVFEREVL
ncbi:trypsin-like serine protease [Halovenus sp. WSH3]|uniref:Trypsin-like serine protease n=1 Tax=Halovenus carboxidivorans TaxID=2692199 RepID=A0A6B0T4H7_9EURY|nr:trypsin-like serine protease [Halovenus carboxidivorans]